MEVHSSTTPENKCGITINPAVAAHNILKQVPMWCVICIPWICLQETFSMIEATSDFAAAASHMMNVPSCLQHKACCMHHNAHQVTKSAMQHVVCLRLCLARCNMLKNIAGSTPCHQHRQDASTPVPHPRLSSSPLDAQSSSTHPDTSA